MYIIWKPVKVQVNLCRKLLFLQQLTHNMTTDCWLFMKTVSSEYLQNMLCTQIVVFVLFWLSEQFWYTTCSADVASFWKRFGCTCQYVIRTNLTNLVLKKHISWLASPLFIHESTFTYVIDLYYVIYVHKSKYYLDNISLFHANWCMYLMQTANNDIIVSKNYLGHDIFIHKWCHQWHQVLMNTE